MSIIVLVHAVLFLVFWLTNLSFQQAMNKFLADATGLGVDFLRIFLVFAAVVFLWSAVRLALRKDARKAGPGWLYNAIGGFFLVFFYGSFVVLFIKNPVQLARLGQFIQYFRIFVDAILLCLAAWGLRSLLVKLNKRWRKMAAIGAFLALWLVPVFWTPGLVYRGALPAKPRLMAHRGTSGLAMENTLGSMMAVRIVKVYGIEIDITISHDGVLFLMHDATLERTTNVAGIFPGRENDLAGSFTWNELSLLEVNMPGDMRFPYNSIPTLTETLQFIRDNNLYLIYDLRIPSADHPYADTAFDLTLAEIKAAGVANRTWVLATPDEIPVVRAVLPDAILAKGLDYRHPVPPQELVDSGYQLVNSEYGLSNRMIRAYENAGLWVNIWTVDEPWQYSRLWLAGVDSVTSNNLLTFYFMSHPFMAISYTLYLVIWGLIGVIAAGIVSWSPKQDR
jgi:glycerophosphoryl diester phosphodiesterase